MNDAGMDPVREYRAFMQEDKEAAMKGRRKKAGHDNV